MFSRAPGFCRDANTAFLQLWQPQPSTYYQIYPLELGQNWPKSRITGILWYLIDVSLNITKPFGSNDELQKNCRNDVEDIFLSFIKIWCILINVPASLAFSFQYFLYVYLHTLFLCKTWKGIAHFTAPHPYTFCHVFPNNLFPNCTTV